MMSAYRKRWIEILKDQNIADWHIDEHGQAIVIRVPNEDADAVEAEMPAIIDKLNSGITETPVWLKFIFYNSKIRVQYILNPELKGELSAG